MLTLNHKQLEVYKISVYMVKEVYHLVQLLPKEELFGLKSQLKRAAVSVCSNIAEGASHASKKERKRFYEVSRSSLVEIDTQIIISIEVGYLTTIQTVKLNQFMESVYRMLSTMIRNLGN